MNDEFPRHCWQHKISFTIPKNVAVTVWTNLTLLIFQSWQEENNKQHYFILLLCFNLYRHLSLLCLPIYSLKNVYFCVFSNIQNTIMLHGLVTICQRITRSAVCPSPHQPSLETSLMMASVTWPHSLGSVTQHDAGRGHKYVTQSCVTVSYNTWRWRGTWTTTMIWRE